MRLSYSFSAFIVHRPHPIAPLALQDAQCPDRNTLRDLDELVGIQRRPWLGE